MVLWDSQLQTSTLTFLFHWQVSHWLAARGCECSVAAVCPPECWKCQHSSWLLIIALIVVWQPEFQERNVMNMWKYFTNLIRLQISSLFFLLYRYDICTYKNKPCGTLGEFCCCCCFIKGGQFRLSVWSNGLAYCHSPFWHVWNYS